METKIGNITRKVAAITVAVTLLALIAVYIIARITITNSGYDHETGLNGQYVAAQNELSTCVTTIRETANIAGAQADKFAAVMEEAIKGRYDGREANPGTMFSAIAEQYPDLAPLNAAYERVHNVVVGCRTEYKLDQDKLIDRLRAYDSWRLNWFVRTIGPDFPTQELVANIGGDRSRKGTVAHEKMWDIVLTEDTVETYNSGELNPETPFPTPSQ